MSTSVWRWLLSPWTSWRAWQLARASQGNLSFDAAWRRIRLERHPDDMPYQQHGHVAAHNEIEDPRSKQQR
ncbi:hypothetical protein [Streptomyces sp. S4.7]|uniref:hypothetical protein n=1 Tax=Streptomyces sp. S4.7 TaxID=2705439 RepID=UPI0013DCBADA|nr:hypothetical protein [Streptomyces sp. S4.7]